jgi:hypothetical protein
MTILTFAYIDPGTGSIVVQLIMAASVGVVYRFRKLLARVVNRLRSR